MLGAAVDVGGGRQGHGCGADLAQTVLDKGDLFEGRSMRRLGGGASVRRHAYLGGRGDLWRVRVLVGGNEGKDETLF